MIFTTEPFLIFAAVFFPAYFLAPNARWQTCLTLFASYVFYGWWDWRFLGLIAASTAFNFAIAPYVRHHRAALWVAIAANLGLLGVFKYLGFFVEQFTTVSEALGLRANPGSLNIILPVGISFFTFQALSYVIDVSRGRIESEHSILRFAAYIALFPQLVAGPIVRAARLLPQLRQHQGFRWPNFWIGAEQILIGAALKMVIADRLAPLVDRAFAVPEALSSLALTLAAFFFSVQIYADFAGYSLMAIGLGRIMGLSFPVNFRRPYLSRSPSEFWRRWHISLSTWLRDYLYIPLGGNRRGADRNLVSTMVLGGLWHGAGWTFLIWGLLHGFLLSAGRRLAAPPLGRWPSRIGLFAVVTLAWVFFRADTIGQALTYLGELFSISGAGLAGLGSLPSLLLTMCICLTFLASEALLEDSAQARQLMRLRTARLVRAGGLCLSLALFSSFSGGAFVYFQF